MEEHAKEPVLEKPLALLVIDEVEPDFLRIERHLRQQGVAARCVRVAGGEGVVPALAAARWDVVLSDHDSLAFIEESHPELPVVLLSDSLDEEMATRLLDGRVADFILKSNLTRLVPAIRRAIREADERRGRKEAQAALRESEAQLQAICQNISEGVVTASLAGELLFWNRAALRMYGYANLEDCRGGLPRFNDVFQLATLAGEILPGDEWPLSRILRGEVLHDLELQVTRLDQGWTRIHSFNGSLVRDPEGVPLLSLLSMHDITEHKQAEMALQASEARFRSYIEYAPVATLVTDRQGKFVNFNPAALAMLGYDGPALLQLSIPDVVAEADREAAVQDFAHCVASGHHEGEYRLLRRDGGIVWTIVRAVCLNYDRFLAFCLDITERKAQEETQRWAALLFANIQDGAVVTDRDGAIVAVNPAFTTITGYTEAEMLGENMRYLQAGQHDPAFYQQMWKDILTTGGWQGEIWNRRKDGEAYLEHLTINAVYDLRGEVANYVGIFTDITRLKHARQMEYLAHHDALTGLPNRLQLLSRLGHALEITRRHRSDGAVLFFDLDGFKAVNDTWGHPAGDELLQHVARRLTERLRDMDTLARLGGDEFVVVLEDIDGPPGAATVASELVELLGQPFVLGGGQEVRIGGSIGIACFPTEGDSPEQLLRHADTALYEAKRAGKNTYRFFQE